MYFEKRVIAGKTEEVSRYYSVKAGVPEGIRRRKLEPTPERIRKSNIRRRGDRLRQLMNANFTDRDFLSLTLTYRDGEEPQSIRQVRDDAADFVKRLRKCARLFGVDLKYIYVIGAGMHRRHVHITTNSLPDLAILTGCWIHGHVSMTPLYSDGQYRDLADYYIKNAMETKEQEEALGEKPGQMYVPSKNLDKPIEIKRVIKSKEFRNDPKPRKGYYIEKGSVYQGWTEAGFPLLRFTMIKEKHERDKVVHFYRREGEGTGSVQDVLAYAVREGRAGSRGKGRPRPNRGKSKKADFRRDDRCRHEDKRRQ